MPRNCFVIMPFSKTDTCSTKQWTWIYTNLFKKAVEESGLDYECKRSTATRGNIIKGIIQELDESFVVIADLTDQNPNVFYELGIRHSLGPRTILIAQKRKQIPFDLPGIKDTVLLHQGIPSIIRAPNLNSVIDREQLPNFFSYYFERLGFECAINNNTTGRVILYYRNVRQDDAKLMVYDVTFRNLAKIKAEAQRRLSLLSAATTHEELPRCPSWMCRYCEYSSKCGL